MNFIDDMIIFIRKYLSKINFGKVYIYKIQENIIEIDHDIKYLEKRFLIEDLSIDRVVDGRLTISIPADIAGKISEIMLISE